MADGLEFTVDGTQTATLSNTGQSPVDLGQFAIKAGRSELEYTFRKRSLRPTETFKLFSGENAERLKRQYTGGGSAIWTKADVFSLGEEGQPDVALLVANSDGSTVLSCPVCQLAGAASGGTVEQGGGIQSQRRPASMPSCMALVVAFALGALLSSFCSERLIGDAPTVAALFGSEYEAKRRYFKLFQSLDVDGDNVI
jgi:hypothetical protein